MIQRILSALFLCFSFALTSSFFSDSVARAEKVESKQLTPLQKKFLKKNKENILLSRKHLALLTIEDRIKYVETYAEFLNKLEKLKPNQDLPEMFSKKSAFLEFLRRESSFRAYAYYEKGAFCPAALNVGKGLTDNICWVGDRREDKRVQRHIKHCSKMPDEKGLGKGVGYLACPAFLSGTKANGDRVCVRMWAPHATDSSKICFDHGNSDIGERTRNDILQAIVDEDPKYKEDSEEWDYHRENVREVLEQCLKVDLGKPCDYIRELSIESARYYEKALDESRENSGSRPSAGAVLTSNQVERESGGSQTSVNSKKQSGGGVFSGADSGFNQSTGNGVSSSSPKTSTASGESTNDRVLKKQAADACRKNKFTGKSEILNCAYCALSYQNSVVEKNSEPISERWLTLAYAAMSNCPGSEGEPPSLEKLLRKMNQKGNCSANDFDTISRRWTKFGSSKFAERIYQGNTLYNGNLTRNESNFLYGENHFTKNPPKSVDQFQRRLFGGNITDVRNDKTDFTKNFGTSLTWAISYFCEPEIHSKVLKAKGPWLDRPTINSVKTCRKNAAKNKPRPGKACRLNKTKPNNTFIKGAPHFKVLGRKCTINPDEKGRKIASAPGTTTYLSCKPNTLEKRSKGTNRKTIENPESQGYN